MKNKQLAEGTLTFKQRFCYSISNLGIVLVWTSMSTFLMLFYTDVALLPTATIGLFILLSRFLDAFVEFIQGFIIDRGKSPKGKYRVWLFRMAIPFGAAAVLCFTAFPEWPVAFRLMYAVVTYNIMNTFIYSMIDMPYNALAASMTESQYERSILNIFRIFMAIIGGVIVNFGVPALLYTFGGGPAAWQITFAILGAIAAILLYFTYFTTKETVVVKEEPEEKLPAKVAFRALFRNKYWVIMLVFCIVSYTSSSLGGINAFFVREILGDLNLLGLLALFGVIPMLVGVFLLAPLVKRFGKRNAAMCGIFSVIIGALIVAIAGVSLTTVLIGTVFRSLGGAWIIGTLFALIQDAIEYGEWKSGVRTGALVTTASAVGGNVGTGFGVAIVGFALSIGGYIAVETGALDFGPTGQPESALAAINFVYIWLPIILSVIMAILLSFNKLDKEYPMILEELKARRAEAGAGVEAGATAGVEAE